jgi:GTP-binding protein
MLRTVAKPARKQTRRRLKPRSPRVSGGRGYPFVAIVGRPNVGKSTLFNRLLGQRLAITEDTAGTTRDRVAALLELEGGRTVELCDMGGIGGTGDPLDKDVNDQIDLAINFADMILFVVDAREGLMPHDEEIARRLKKLDKPVIVVVNKCETAGLEASSGEFYSLGFPGDVQCVSAREGDGRSDLLELIPTHIADDMWVKEDAEEDGPRDIRIAIVGRRNAGKSTFVNTLLGEERVIASERAGTTRDAVDVRVSVAGRDVILIDTAGIRKRGKADDHIEIISHGRAETALRRCDVALLFLDALRDIGNVDKRLGSLIRREHKACVVIANKWDLVGEKMTVERFADYAGKLLPNLSFCPIIGVSAKEGFHDHSAIKMAFELYGQSQVRVSTGALNRALAEIISLRRPRAVKNRIGKIFFGTQIATNPVTILLFVNYPELFAQNYRRFLQGQLRKRLPWDEIPIKLCFRGRETLKKRGRGLAQRVKELSGLSDRARWVEDSPDVNIRDIGATLDAADVQAVLLDAFGADELGDDDVPAREDDENA